MGDRAFRQMGALAGSTIRRLIAGQPSLVADYVDLEQQIQPNGIDLTLESVWVSAGRGTIGRSNAERALPARWQVEPVGGWYSLAAGLYIVRLNEMLRLPDDLLALGQPRSSLLRCGVTVYNAVWDAGYAGRSEVLLNVLNPGGFRVAEDARVLQLVFLRLDRPTVGYAGAYQGENLRQDRKQEDK